MQISRTWIELAQELEITRSMKKVYEEREETLRNELVALQRGQSYAEGKYVMIKETAKGSIKYAQIPQLAGLDLEQYRGTPVVRWLFKILE